MKIVILGSTGSVGRNVLEVCKNLEDIEVCGITANKGIELFDKQLQYIRPQKAVIADGDSYKKYLDSFDNNFTDLFCGSEKIIELVETDEVDMVVNALSGIAGLEPTIRALKKGKKVATANKESIVMGWNLIKDNIKYQDQLIPVDSEHSAIYQSIKGEIKENIKKIILTASGGAVYNLSTRELEKVKVNDCLSHPTWDMGHKITIDSSTLMNKGFEIIEAHNLFSIDYSKIEVFIHPQSLVHGMVEYIDGSIIAHISQTDMKLPIQYALTHPFRKKSPVRRLSIDEMNKLEFFRPDEEKFSCLKIAVQAGKQGGIKPIILCAADEVAVEAFSKGKIGFTDIPKIVENAMHEELDYP
ncbi:MAG: 1-deoxy-D-xylulose-5-phosphate reductoisomerase, partial [Elusimicrobiota bacterium]